MISICIPVYKCEIEDAISKLATEAAKLPFEVEVLVIDDGSPSYFREKNRIIANFYSIEYYELSQNQGRIKVREILAQCAKFPYLIFVDGDTIPAYKNFIFIYSLYIVEGCVIYGGGLPLPYITQNNYLSFIYKKNRHYQDVKRRIKKRYQTFHTDNFLVDKKIFLANWKFPEELKNYGYEDFLFARNLCKSGISIMHIDNPVLHKLKDNREFIKDMEESVKNLYIISETIKDDFVPKGAILLRKIKKINFLAMLKYFEKFIRVLLEKKMPEKISLFLMDIWRIAFFFKIRIK